VIVVDSSALLAFLSGEEGAEIVESRLDSRARCSAANWAEVAQKVRAADADWPAARALLVSYGLQVEPVLETDAERAAGLWTRGSGLSLADCLCLALGDRLQARILTADHAWASMKPSN
jgi:ribonuclease VapC